MTITDLPSAAEHGQGKGSGNVLITCWHTGCDFETYSPAGFKRHLTRQHSSSPRALAADTTEPDPSAPPEDDLQEDAEPEEQEQAPRAPRSSSADDRGALGRLRDRMRRGKTINAKSRPKVTKPRHSRIPIASDLANAWSTIGRNLQQTPHFPAGRMMSLQAPAAGLVIDRALEGTVVDRLVVQPLWRTKDNWEEVFYVAGPPVLLISIQNARMRAMAALEEGDQAAAAKYERIATVQGGMLESLLRSSLIKMAPSMAEARARQEEEDVIIREAFPELGTGEDPVKALLSELFAPPPWAGPQPTPQEAPE